MRNIVDFQARQAATSGTSCYPGDEQEVSAQDNINRSEMKGIFFSRPVHTSIHVRLVSVSQADVCEEIIEKSTKSGSSSAFRKDTGLVSSVLVTSLHVSSLSATIGKTSCFSSCGDTSHTTQRSSCPSLHPRFVQF